MSAYDLSNLTFAQQVWQLPRSRPKGGVASLTVAPYNYSVIRYQVVWSDAILEDLDQLYDSDDELGLIAEALFDAIDDSPDLKERLALGRATVLNPRFDVGGWAKAISAGYNLYKLKLWDENGSLFAFRLIYALDHRTPRPRIVMLGLVPRSDNYELHSQIGQRILHDYEEYDVPPIPRNPNSRRSSH